MCTYLRATQTHRDTLIRKTIDQTTTQILNFLWKNRKQNGEFNHKDQQAD